MPFLSIVIVLMKSQPCQKQWQPYFPVGSMPDMLFHLDGHWSWWEMKTHLAELLKGPGRYEVLQCNQKLRHLGKSECWLVTFIAWQKVDLWQTFYFDMRITWKYLNLKTPCPKLCMFTSILCYDMGWVEKGQLITSIYALMKPAIFFFS